MTAFASTNINVIQNSLEITVNDGIDFSQVARSSVIFIDTWHPVIVDAGTAPVNGLSTLTLRTAWTNASVTSGKCLVLVGMPALADYVAQIKGLGDRLAGYTEANRDLFTTDNPAYPIKISSTQTVNVPTYLHLVNQYQTALNMVNAELGNVKATKWVDFERYRQINRDRFAASGYIEPGKHIVYQNNQYKSINQGLWMDAGQPNQLFLGRSVADAVGTSRTVWPRLNVDGVTVQVSKIGGPHHNTLKLPPAPTAAVEATNTTTASYGPYDFVVFGNLKYICIKDALAGALLTDTTYFKPVQHISREDVIAFEVFLAPISGPGKKPFYPHGIVQQVGPYQGITMSVTSALGIDGVTQSYCAVFEGDTVTDGSGADFEALSASDKDTCLNDPLNNICVRNGVYYQWHCRQRTIRGLGNDWANVRPTDNLKFDGDHFVKPRGIQNAVSDLDTYNNVLGYYSDGSLSVGKSAGLFAAANSGGGVNASVAVDGQCYLLPVARVTRLNQGAYHPAVNPLGCQWSLNAAENGTNYWDTSAVKTMASTADTFVYNGDFLGRLEGRINASGGRHDGALFDAVYDWQIEDLRRSARGENRTPDHVLQSFVNNEYRGFEKLPVLNVMPNNNTVTVSGGATYWPGANGQIYFPVSAASGGLGTEVKGFQDMSATHWIIQGNNGNTMVFKRPFPTSSNNYVQWPHTSNNCYVYGTGDVSDRVEEFNTKFPIGTVLTIAAETLSDIAFTDLPMVNVIGSITRLHAILARHNVTQLLGGVLSSTMPFNDSRLIQLRRRNLAGHMSYNTMDNGVTWSRDAMHTVTAGSINGHIQAFHADAVWLVCFSTPAYSLLPANQASVSGAQVSQVWAGNSHYYLNGSIFCGNLTDVVPTGVTTPQAQQGGNLKGFWLKDNAGQNNCLSTTSGYLPTHEPIRLAAPSDGVKAFCYLHDDEAGQRWAMIAFKQLRYDVSLADGVQFTDVTGDAVFSFQTGKHYHILSGPRAGYWFCVSSSGGLALDDGRWSENANGELIYALDGKVYFRRWDGDGYGDDHSFSIASNLTTIPDDNGNLVKVGCYRAFLGYTPTEAKQ